jgi:succinate dehydrogenase / fumarate reductase iron-sulfur subunit
MQIRLKVSRYNPEDGQQAARYSEYSIDVAESATVLDSLLQVRDYEDGTLALRYSCRSAICGSCAMRVNGRVHLACKTKVVAVAKGDGRELVVEPMGNMPVIKDLVSDMELYWAKVRQITPWLLPVTQPEREFLVPHAAMRDLSNTMNCIHCGACVSACTVLEVDKSFIGPAALAKAYRFAGDPRDGHQKDRMEYLSGVAGGIWDCTRCNMCVEVCPKDVRPMDRIMQLRDIAVGDGIRGTTGVRHGDSFAGSVRRLGRLDEARLLPESVGFWNVPRLLSELPGGLRMLRVGKLPWSHAMPWHKPIPGVKHVRRIFDAVRAEKKGTVAK